MFIDRSKIEKSGLWKSFESNLIHEFVRLDIQKFKQIAPENKEEILEEVLRIYLTYFKSDSLYEINITAKEIHDLEERLKKPDPNVFNTVQVWKSLWIFLKFSEKLFLFFN